MRYLAPAALITLVVLALVAACGIAARWIDRDGLTPVVQSIFPLFGLLAVGVFVLALAVGAWVGFSRPMQVLLVLLLLLAAVPAALAVPTLVSHTVRGRPGDEVIMTSNMEFGRASTAPIMAAVRAHHVETLVLVEVTPDALRRLDAAGLRTLLPHRVGETRTDFRGTVIASSHPLTEERSSVPDGGAGMPVAQVRTAAGSYLLRGVHTYAPLPDLAPKWRAGLDELRTWHSRQPVGEPLVMAGDFNASTAMPAFRRAASGMTDAQRATGSGWVRTWPNGRSYPPFVALDHILLRDADVVSSGSVTVADTDHRAVWARVRLR
ncbi:endonuclease/exonuclease/phosphatase family protein [Allobranchiibius sp. CTAmp26]|uniref:endonuclease/exonuclease/phosphatase family protein n=1 Tax=Allobranchiibius sp. CTAmp26 TaxID=2815214 RepID=UPI001AA0E266|nr:endonuclease/exonuclease/phosphatase family protein [Allobranchiibius sp. CTAmp26]MBO1755145.1 endonuclease/exonuclease/phosphatase family protein [Allobranchiibius sp. CTAmp26]